MKRYYLLIVPVLLASALAWADQRSADGERVRQLQRNLDLIQSLVDGGLLLAGESDPVQRANHCNSMAERFAGEMSKATDERDAWRVVELGRHLKALLDDGVAANLSQVRGGIPAGSADEKKVFEVRDRTVRVVGRLEEDLRRVVDAAPQSELRQVLEQMQEGRSQVERSAVAPIRPKEKSKNKGSSLELSPKSRGR